MKRVLAGHHPERTQRARHDTSLPMRWIVDNHEVCGDVLHYGEGKAFKDTELLETVANTVTPYDPYSPNPDTRERYRLATDYDFGVAVYVLNVLPSLERKWVLQSMLASVTTGIVAVRTDVEVMPWHRLMDDGVLTRKDTFQSLLDHQGWLDWFWRNGFDGPWWLHKAPSWSVFQLMGDAER